mmetsp:Transcript_41830/g.131076  ORF Transcript_41830/g.131076 Transcript_41830/m.131076 type:complete len:603 (+) Transcript_41830:252-2060(+)
MIHGNATQEAVECVPWDEMPAFETEVCQGREICVAVGEDREGECLCNYVLGYERSHEGRCVVTAGYYLNTAWMVGCIVTNVVVVVRVAKVLRRSYDTRTDHRKNATSKFVSVFLWLMMCYAAVALAQFSVYLYTMIAHAHTGTWRSTWDTLLMTGATLFNLSLGMGPLLFTTGLTGSFRSGSLSPSARATGIKSGDQPNTPARPRILNGERLTAAMYMFWATPLLLTLLILPVGILTAAAAMSVYTAVIVGPAFLIIGGKARRSMLDSPDPRVQEHAEIMKTLLWRARIGFTLLATLLVPAGALSGGVAASSALARKITTYTVVALYQIVTGSRAYMAFSMCDYALNLHELAGLFRTSRSDAKAASLTEYTRGVLGIVVEKPAEEKSQRRAARVAPLPGGLSKAEYETVDATAPNPNAHPKPSPNLIPEKPPRVKIMRMRSSGVASRSRRGKRRKEKRKAAAALRNAAEIPRRWSTRTRSSAAASRMRRGWRRSAEVIVSPAAAAKVTSTATGGTTPATISTAPSTAPGGTTLWTSGAATLWASGAAALRTSCANILCTSCAATARAVPLVISSNSRSQKHTPTTPSLASFRDQITPASRAS